jgi:hypothetical protein
MRIHGVEQWRVDGVQCQVFGSLLHSCLSSFLKLGMQPSSKLLITEDSVNGDVLWELLHHVLLWKLNDHGLHRWLLHRRQVSQRLTRGVIQSLGLDPHLQSWWLDHHLRPHRDLLGNMPACGRAHWFRLLTAWMTEEETVTGGMVEPLH